MTCNVAEALCCVSVLHMQLSTLWAELHATPCSHADDVEGTLQAQLIRFACTEAGDADMLSNIVVCHRELGFTPVEVNASDTRNKADNSALKGIGAKLANSIKELATNTAIGMGADHKPKKVSPHALRHSVLDCCPA